MKKLFKLSIKDFLIGLIVLTFVTLAHGELTKQFKFFDFGIYTVPESFPENFINFDADVTAAQDLGNGKASAIVVEHRFSGSLGHLLVVRVLAYTLRDQIPHIVCVKEITLVRGIETATIYVDTLMLTLGESSKVLTKVEAFPDLEKFLKERDTALRKVQI